MTRPQGERSGTPPSTHSDLLRETVEALVGESPPGTSDTSPIRRDLMDLVTAIEAVCSGRDPSAVRNGLPPRSRRAGLFRALRGALLERCDDDGSDAGRLRRCIALLAAMDRLRPPASAYGHADASSVEAFLEEPDAFELLVEVAHDMRSPLTSVLFLSEALRGGQSGEVNEIQRTQLGLIYSAALGLQSLACDLVDLARGDVDPDSPAPLSIQRLFSDLGALVQPMADEKGIEFRTVTPDGDRYLGRALPLSRILLNLITNALKFTSEGFVEVSARPAGHGRLEFSVRDTGRGISADQLNNLFEPFKKSSDRQGYFFSGAGLGLTIARRMARQLESELGLETEPGWGTRFFFTVEMSPLD